MIITIDGVGYNASYPVGATLTHEGGLNQANVQIRHINRQDAFLPFTYVDFLGELWCVARDDVVREKYLGKATHNLMLVEATKRLERVICGAKTFTKPLYTSYTPVPIRPTYTRTTWDTVDDQISGEESTTAVTADDLYFIPAASGESVSSDNYAALRILSYYTKSFTMPTFVFAQNKTSSNELVSTRAYYQIANGAQTTISANTTINTIGSVKLSFECITRFAWPLSQGQYTWTRDTVTYTLEITEQPVSKAPLSVYAVTERLLLSATPLRNPYEREFYHTTYQSGCIDTTSILAPEFSFANGATLKENLDQIAKHLHAKVKMSKNGTRRDIYFVPLTTNTRAAISGTPIGDQASFESEKYAGRLHVNAANLTIANAREGAMAEPCGTTFSTAALTGTPMRSLRCTDGKARIDESGGEIETVLPIKNVCALKMFDGENTWDITPYVKEETEYLALSDYETSQSKAYALYYRRGDKNIKGLFFKEEGAIFEALAKYAIVNIYKQAAGESAKEMTTYQDLLFYVEYEPYTNLHLVSSRTDGKGGAVAYIANQAANETDKDLLADFARGTVEQMASDAPKMTFLFRSLSDLPKVGTMYNANTYISEISFELYPYFVKASLSLSEHYNRLGQRVEVPNQIRQYEIDVNNVQDRSVLYTDVCTISETLASEDDSLLSAMGKHVLLHHVINDDHYITRQIANYSASAAKVTTYVNYMQDNQVPTDFSGARALRSVLLPVASFGFANSVVFVIPFQDNFSAGSIATAAGAGFNLKDHVPYGDAYGDADFIRFSLHNGMTYASGTHTGLGRALPQCTAEAEAALGAEYASTANNIGEAYGAIRVYKDSRERIILSYQILFQSDSGIIIGNDFAANSHIVRDFSQNGLYVGSNPENSDSVLYLYGTGSDGKLYLHPITGTTETSSRAYKTTNVLESGQFGIRVNTSLPSHSAWAILRNGEFMLGANKPFPKSQTLYFNFSHKGE